MNTYRCIARSDVLFSSQRPCFPCTGAGVKHVGVETPRGLWALFPNQMIILGPMDFTFLWSPVLMSNCSEASNSFQFGPLIRGVVYGYIFLSTGHLFTFRWDIWPFNFCLVSTLGVVKVCRLKCFVWHRTQITAFCRYYFVYNSNLSSVGSVFYKHVSELL